jgi:ApbE superfamily uncharacterized protein (UPF0280 family)
MPAGGHQARRLPDGRRLFLQHGPMDVVVEAFGPRAEVERAYGQAEACFAGILAALVAELPALRRPVGATPPEVTGPVARRMAAAVWPHRAVFVTPMAAVAGAVADEVLAALVAGRDLAKAYVNDGGDIALYLTPDERFVAGLVADLEAPAIDGTAEIAAAMPVRGIATSGRSGRSFSLGIADAVTVLARDAAAADAAATLIANRVNLDHPAIERRPASSLRDDADLGDLPVTVTVGPLSATDVAVALASGAAEAERMLGLGLIEGAALFLRGQHRVVGAVGRFGYSAGTAVLAPAGRRAAPGSVRRTK